MKRFNIEWHTEANRAGGVGWVEAEDEEKALAEARIIIKDTNPLLTEEEVETLVINLTEAE